MKATVNRIKEMFHIQYLHKYLYQKVHGQVSNLDIFLEFGTELKKKGYIHIYKINLLNQVLPLSVSK